MIEESSLDFIVLRLENRHEYRRFHVHCAMEAKNGRQTFFNDLTQDGVLRRVSLNIIEKPSSWARGLGEQRRENGLMVG
jgi:hypothetical protein